ncbi:MAG TPA: D-amino-acid transaminase [Xanthobacteraceae bacterium]|nr:D-amino-acid transaminase [Xanthobacteraceae bacterium]
MSRIAYVNGRYVPFRDARVHIEDRGYQLGDGVYEVCEIRGGSLVDERRHLERLQRSLAALRIGMPISPNALRFVFAQMLRRNRIRDGLIYLQITRGVARRDHGFPERPVTPSIVITVRGLDPAKIADTAAKGISVITVPDDRWGRVDIKTIGLLPNVLARQAAKEQGAKDAWFVDADGFVTEGASSNAWIVTGDGKLVTRPSSNRILTGITMTVAKEVAKSLQLSVEERAFSVAEAQAAREAFVTSATQTVMPVVRIDGQAVGSGEPGPIAKRLRIEFHKAAEIGPSLL